MIKLNSKMLTKSLFKKLQNSLDTSSYWKDYLNSFESLEEMPNGIHLAILVEPYLTYVLEGKKTVESRFSINRCPPYKKVHSGDILLLKLSGGPIVGICKVTNVWSYQLDPSSWKTIRKEFTDSLCAQDPEFWYDRRYACFATLMKINHPTTFTPLEIEKKDRRGWVVLRSNEKQLTLDELV